ncbi:MAG TPA: phage holin family protein [Thermoanaerobaculia bacterium]|jgi:putative membrane protein
MLHAIVQVVLNGVAILIASRIVPGIHYTGSLGYLLLVGLVFGLVNLLVKPLVALLSLPLIILTLGLFYLVINGLMLYLSTFFLAHLKIDGCMPAILGGLVIGVFNWVVRAFTRA